jgi:mycobactin lysine-N-oxygenase
MPASLPEASDKVLSVERYWGNHAQIRDLVGARIAIVGAGETAAAIALDLVQFGNPSLEITVVSPSGMAYTRGESFRESHVYSDPGKAGWSALTADHRREFINRTDRGVFSPAANRILDTAGKVEIAAGRVEGVRLDTDGTKSRSATCSPSPACWA